MYRTLLAFILTSFFTAGASGQVLEDHSDYQDLFDLYVFKKYEKCLKKAERYQENDKYRRDPEPYLFMSVCYLQIHKNPDKFDPEIAKRPLRDALKSAYRFKKKDKLLFLQNLNQEHLNELRSEALKHGLHYVQQENYRKASYYLKWTSKVYPEDYTIKLLYGMSQLMGNNYEGYRNIDLAHKMMNEQLSDNKEIALNSDIDPVVSNYFMEFIEYWDEKQNESKTLQTISMAHLILGDDSGFWAKL